MNDSTPDAVRGARSAPVLAALGIAALLLCLFFAALGSWQLQRRVWKLDLIERVDQRVHAAPVAPPPPERWPQVNAAQDEYRHVQLQGRFLHERETLVQASTRLGPGFWVLTPLRRDDGTTVLVNRGFVPPEVREPSLRSSPEQAGEVRLTGLLRLSEPGGGFLRRNDPANGRWFSRDVEAIASARGLDRVAPFFVDEDAQGGTEPARWPRPGLTVISFPNNHLVYALTWYGLALLVAGAAWQVARTERRLRRENGGTA